MEKLSNRFFTGQDWQQFQSPMGLDESRDIIYIDFLLRIHGKDNCLLPGFALKVRIFLLRFIHPVLDWSEFYERSVSSLGLCIGVLKCVQSLAWRVGSVRGIILA